MVGGGMSSMKERADPLLPGSVGAPMSGDVVEVKCQAGAMVKAGEALVVMSAMKMETTVSAPVSGMLTQVCKPYANQWVVSQTLTIPTVTHLTVNVCVL